MRVVHIIGQLVPGGSEKMTLQLAAGLRARGDDHLVVAMGEVDKKWVADVGGDVPVVSLAIDHDGGRGSIGGLARLGALLRAERPDILHGHVWRSSVLVAILGRMLRRRTVATLHRVYYPALEQRVDRVVQHGWDRVVVDSEAVRELLTHEVAIDPARIESIPNFVAAEYFELGAPDPSDDPLRLLMAAHFTPTKGHETLLRAMCVLRDETAGSPGIHLDLLGDGPLLDAMRETCSAWGLDAWVSFHGRQRDMPRWIARSDAIVLPSSWEGFGMVLAEGMAASRPVVACRAGGAVEVVVDGDTGYLTPVGDERALAGALRRLRDDPALRRKLGAAGRERALRRYTQNPVLDAYADLYRRLADGR